MAMLAAFSLLNRAYDVVARAEGLSDRQRVAIVKLLAESIGGEGIIAGQESDLRLKADMQYQHLVQMHERKTGALFVGAALIGACVANLSSVESEPVAKFARNFGLAFQVLDDLLDATASAATAGKDVSQDTDKVTFVSLMGVHETRAFAGHLIESAVYALRPLGARVGPLVELAYGLLDSSPQPADGRVAAL
jgi:geranylgeranyl pyrophosphate synthase